MNMIVTEKHCTVCGKLKELSSFSKDSRNKNGVRGCCKTCQNEQVKAWQRKNPVRTSINRRRSYEKHMDSRRAKSRIDSKEYRKKNHEMVKEKERIRSRVRRIERPEWVREIQRRSEAKNYAKNLPKIIMKVANRRALKKLAFGKITSEEWQKIKTFYGEKCLCCGRSDVKLSIDHVIPLARGGNNTPDNVQPLCVSCNSRKGTKTIDYRPLKYGG